MKMNKSMINWKEIERGVPITNDSYFVRIDTETGFIFDDRGGFMHQSYCGIDTRREITWLTHELHDLSPVDDLDVVIIETTWGKMAIKKASEVSWEHVKRYRVLRQAE